MNTYKYHRWTNKELKMEASLYLYRAEFQKKNRKAYKSAYKKGILDSICSHMKNKYVDWSFESIRHEALKYNTRGEFQKKCSGYQVALRGGFLDKVCSHMLPAQNKPYTLNRLKKEAKKYKTKTEFQIGSVGAYEAALKRPEYKDICSHMPEYTRIGETNPAFKWTLEMLLVEAKKYKTRTQFAKQSPNAYTAAQKRSLLDTICTHMKSSGTASLLELELFAVIKTKLPTAQKFRDRKVKIENRPHIVGFDLDIFIPELKLAIEFDGKYWHSDKGLKRSRKHWPQEDIGNYHQIKDDYFASKGIQILHINESDWNKDKEICIQKCLDFLRGNCNAISRTSP